jgi:ribokinase
MGNIVVVGSANTDMILKCERLPLAGETILGGEFAIAAGGKGANQAVAAGCCVSTVGIIPKRH